jgi:hypothetical protein
MSVAGEEDLLVGGLVVAARAGGGLGVDQGQVSAVDHAEAGQPRAHAQVHVLPAVHELLVETDELQEELPPHGDARSGDEVAVERGERRGVVAGLVSKEMKRTHVTVRGAPPGAAAVLDRAVRIEQPHARHADGGIESLGGKRVQDTQPDFSVVVE